MKKFMSFILILVLLLAAGVALLPKIIPMETLVAKAKEQVKAATGRDVDFKNVSILFWPNLGLTLTDVSLSNPTWAHEKNLVTLGKLDVELALKPLLERRVEVKRFVLTAPKIALEANADGKGSWVIETPKAEGAAATTGDSKSAQKFDFKFGKFEIKNGTLSFLDHKTGQSQLISDINMTLSLPDLKSALQLDGDLSFRKKKVNLSLAIAKPMDFANGTASPGSLNLKTADVTLKAAGVLASTGEMFNGNVDTEISSLSNLVGWASNAEAKKLPFEKISFGSALRATKTDVVLKGANLTLDDIHAKGNLNLGFGGKPEIFARLALADKLNLDRFTGGEKKAETAAAAPAPSQEWSTTPIDFSGLKAVNADLELKTEGFSVSGVDVGASTLTVLLQNGKLNFKSSEATLFGGKFASDLTLEDSRAGFNFKMNGVQAKPVLTNFANFKKLSGAADADISVTASGNNQKAMISSLNGKGSVIFKNGAFEGIDLVNIAQLVQKKLTDMKVGEGKTDFVDLGGSFTITGGVATNNDFKMRGPLVQATGKGSVDLPRKYVAYRVTPVLTASSATENANGISVPVDIKGPFNAIKVIPDFAAVVKNALENPDQLKGQAKDIAKGVRDQVREIRKDPAKALQNILGVPMQ